MSEKQDRQGARTATDLERKYNFGKTFAELMGIALDARESVDSLASTLRSEMLDQATSITRNTEQIILSALETYVATEDLGEFQRTVESELLVMADRISLNFESATKQITEVGGKLQTVEEELQKHFDFSVNGLIIKAGENDVQLLLDNGIISFYAGNIDEDNPAKNRLGWWDGVDFHTGNIFVDVNERAQFGDFAFVPRSNGSLDFLKVGG